MTEKKKYDEEMEISSLASWVIVILFSGSIAAFGWIVYLLVPDAPRQWNFGELRDTPAESIYSTDEPNASRKAHRQIQPLPEAQPMPPAQGQRQ